MAKQTFPFIEVRQKRKSFILASLPAGLIVEISYAAIRRQDDEEGAVQRVLNQSRINGVRVFTLHGGDYPASIVLNWVGDNLEKVDGNIVIQPKARSAQIIDGQHRVAGIREAIKEDPSISNISLPVAIYEKLDTFECANIFLSINTEQRPVQRSLVLDLYGIASEDLVDPAAVRAKDITMSLNEQGLPYFDLIKLPNSPRQRGGVALSTAVAAIKPLVEEKGPLDQVGIQTLERQCAVFKNFFNVLSSKYGAAWTEKENAFIYASGFTGAVEFLQLKLIPLCVSHNNFSQQFLEPLLRLDRGNLILQSEVKGLGGKDAPRKVFERLVDAFEPPMSAVHDITF